MPSVVLSEVTKRFDRIIAISDLSLEIADKDYVCVLGPTGSGKTTVLKLIAGLAFPNKGRVFLGDVDMTTIPPEERGAVYVPQQYALFPHMTILENVAFGPLVRGSPEKKALRIAEEMLELMRLAHRAESYPEELSGGMQQRVALARGLATEAKLLLLDEPLGALDARLRVDLRRALRELVKNAGATAVHVTHDQEEAMAVADKIVVLRNGRIDQYATPFHVYSKPQTLFVAHFVGGANFLPCSVAKRGIKESTVELDGGYEVRVADTTYEVDEEAVLVLREDRIRLAEGTGKVIDATVFNVLPGVIGASRFLGSFIGYEIRLENGSTINSKIPISAHSNMLCQGDTARAYFTPSDAMLYSVPSVGLSRELKVY